MNIQTDYGNITVDNSAVQLRRLTTEGDNPEYDTLLPYEHAAGIEYNKNTLTNINTGDYTFCPKYKCLEAIHPNGTDLFFIIKNNIYYYNATDNKITVVASDAVTNDYFVDIKADYSDSVYVLLTSRGIVYKLTLPSTGSKISLTQEENLRPSMPDSVDYDTLKYTGIAFTDDAGRLWERYVVVTTNQGLYKRTPHLDFEIAATDTEEQKSSYLGVVYCWYNTAYSFVAIKSGRTKQIGVYNTPSTDDWTYLSLPTISGTSERFYGAQQICQTDKSTTYNSSGRMGYHVIFENGIWNIGQSNTNEYCSLYNTSNITYLKEYSTGEFATNDTKWGGVKYYTVNQTTNTWTFNTSDSDGEVCPPTVYLAGLDKSLNYVLYGVVNSFNVEFYSSESGYDYSPLLTISFSDGDYIKRQPRYNLHCDITDQNNTVQQAIEKLDSEYIGICSDGRKFTTIDSQPYTLYQINNSLSNDSSVGHAYNQSKEIITNYSEKYGFVWNEFNRTLDILDIANSQWRRVDLKDFIIEDIGDPIPTPIWVYDTIWVLSCKYEASSVNNLQVTKVTPKIIKVSATRGAAATYSENSYMYFPVSTSPTDYLKITSDGTNTYIYTTNTSRSTTYYSNDLNSWNSITNSKKGNYQAIETVTTPGRKTYFYTLAIRSNNFVISTKAIGNSYIDIGNWYSNGSETGGFEELTNYADGYNTKPYGKFTYANDGEEYLAVLVTDSNNAINMCLVDIKSDGLEFDNGKVYELGSTNYPYIYFIVRMGSDIEGYPRVLVSNKEVITSTSDYKIVGIKGEQSISVGEPTFVDGERSISYLSLSTQLYITTTGQRGSCNYDSATDQINMRYASKYQTQIIGQYFSWKQIIKAQGVYVGLADLSGGKTTMRYSQCFVLYSKDGVDWYGGYVLNGNYLSEFNKSMQYGNGYLHISGYTPLQENDYSTTNIPPYYYPCVILSEGIDLINNTVKGVINNAYSLKKSSYYSGVCVGTDSYVVVFSRRGYYTYAAIGGNIISRGKYTDFYRLADDDGKAYFSTDTTQVSTLGVGTFVLFGNYGSSYTRMIVFSLDGQLSSTTETYPTVVTGDLIKYKETDYASSTDSVTDYDKLNNQFYGGTHVDYYKSLKIDDSRNLQIDYIDGGGGTITNSVQCNGRFLDMGGEAYYSLLPLQIDSYIINENSESLSYPSFVFYEGGVAFIIVDGILYYDIVNI